MKRLILINLAISLSCFICMACDDDASAPELENGKTCTSASECQSKYCSPDGVCAQNPAQLLENGSACSAGTACASGYCSASNICDVKPQGKEPAANGTACTSADECASQYCGQSGVCETKPQGGDNTEVVNCSGNDECFPSGKVCYEAKCVTVDTLNGKPCSAGTMTQCMIGAVVECRQWAGMDYYYNVIKCKEGEVCSAYNPEVVTCAKSCEAAKLGDTYTTCDPDNTDDEGWSIGEIHYECIQFGSGYFYVAKDWVTCPLGQACVTNDYCE